MTKPSVLLRGLGKLFYIGILTTVARFTYTSISYIDRFIFFFNRAIFIISREIGNFIALATFRLTAKVASVNRA